jgi:predicted permease
MPDGFRFPKNEEIWLPLVSNSAIEDPRSRPLRLFGVLREGEAQHAAQQELALIAARLAQQSPGTNEGISALVLTFHEAYNGGPVRVVFLLLLGAVVFVLVIVCANVGNLLLIRSVARHREISIRTAMGASRWQIVRQLLVESLLLSVLGGCIGLWIAHFGVQGFAWAAQHAPVPYWVSFQMDPTVFAYFAAISLGSGVAFGLIPALRASRVDLNGALKESAPTVGVRGGRLAGALVVTQFALTLVLLAGAGMMMRSFVAAKAMNEFIPAEQILTARLSLPGGERAAHRDTRQRFFETLLAELSTLPGVTRAAAVSNLPGTGSGAPPLEIEGQPLSDPREAPRAFMMVQASDYLGAIDLPILFGRNFNARDGRIGSEAATVTRAFASSHWPDRNAVGQRFRLLENNHPGPWITVVGVCADFVQNPTETGMPPALFIPHRQEPRGSMVLVLRCAGDPAILVPTLRGVVQKLDPTLPLGEVAVLPAVYQREQWHLRAFGGLFLIFALVAFILAALGIYAVVAHASALRSREIAIRIALGANRPSILKLVLSRGLGHLGAGLALGLVGAVAGARMLGSADVLFRVSPYDPAVFIAVSIMLLAVGLFACWMPARRASRTDPATVLRAD